MDTGPQPKPTGETAGASVESKQVNNEKTAGKSLLDDKKVRLLKASPGIDFFVVIDQCIYEDFKNQSEIKKALQKLSRLKGSPEDILLSIKNNDFSVYETTPEEFSILLELAHIQNKLKVAYIKEAFGLLTASEVGLESWEKSVLPELFEIGLVMDEVYIKWRSSLFPKNAYGLKETGQKNLEKLLGTINDPYTIVTATQDSYEQVAYATFFHKEFQRIIKHIHTIRKILAAPNLPQDAHSFLSYMTALERALGIDQTEKREDEWISVLAWREVDLAWLAYKGNLQIWHGVESGYDKMVDLSGIRIIPEWRVTYLDTSQRHQKINTYLELVQGFYPNFFEPRYFFHERVSRQIRRMRGCDIGIYITLIGSGASLDFCPHGQVAPNERIAARSGFKSSLDSLKEDDIYQKEKFLLTTLCRGQQNENLAEHILQSDEHLGIYIGSHELSHALFGEWGDLEEFKASWTGIIPLREAEETGFFRKNILRDTLVSHFICCLKYLTTEDQNDPYFIESLINMRFFFESGFIGEKVNGYWQLDLDKLLSGTESYFARTNSLYEKIIPLALEENIEDLVRAGTAMLLHNDTIRALTEDVRQANLLYFTQKQRK